MALTIILFIVGLVLIIKGGDFFVDAASWIAEVSGIPKFIVGATIVSIATTLPEMFVSIIASLKGSVDMAVGNAVGSVTANTGLILSIAIVAMSMVISRKQYLAKVILLILSSGIVWIAGLNGSFDMWGVYALFVVFAVFMFENVKSAMAQRDTDSEKPECNGKIVAINILKFVGGAAAIVFGSDLLVDNGTEIARIIGISEGIIAVTLVAIGTSLPELVTTVTAVVKKQSSLSAGNIIGANVIDLTLILPLCSIVSGKQLQVNPQSYKLDMPACFILILIAMIPTLISQKFKKWQGVLMIALYVAYVAAAVVLFR